MSPINPKPRERRAEKMRQNIITTALELLIEQGVEQLSLREIARRMDYTPAALYEYFNDKNELIMALVYKADDLLTLDLEKVASQASPIQKLIETGMIYIHFAQNNPELYRLFSTAPAPVNTNADTHQKGGKSFRLLVKIIQDGVDKGLFITPSSLNVNSMAYASWAMVHGIASLQLNAMKNALDDPDTIHLEILKILISGLINTKNS